MIKKYFWRRSFAYIIDLLVCWLLLTIVVITLNSVFSTNIVSPSPLTRTSCELRDDLFTTKRMNELLPLEEGQSHQQILCKQTNIPIISFFFTQLQKIWSEGNLNYSRHISYYSDENGKQVPYISSGPFFYLFAPLLFALFLTKSGQTPGKRMLGLTVYNSNFNPPDLKSALKREYLKAPSFVIAALFGLYTMLSIYSFDIDEAAELLQAYSVHLEESNFIIPTILSVVLGSIVFWFQFGSFIRWRGQTYWDQFTNLNTNLIEQFNLDKNSKE